MKRGARTTLPSTDRRCRYIACVLHSHEIKVRFYELDPYNHLNHSVYVQYFEVARIELLDDVGFGMEAMADAGFHIVVTGIQTQFRSPARAGDTVVVDTELAELRRVTGRWRQRMRRGDEILASQVVDAAFTNIAGRPTRIPGGFAAAVARFVGHDLM